MGFLNQAIQVPRQHKRNAYILASVVTAIVPAATAGMFIWLMPEGCALRDVDAWVYRWTCLFPGLMVAVPPVIAMLMPVLFFSTTE